MKRRDVLATTAVFVSAGCLGGGNAGTDGGNDSTNGSETTTTGTHTTDTETDAGTVEPTTDAGTDTTTPTTETKTGTATEPTNTATETTTDGTPDSPIAIPDPPTDARKGTPLTGEANVAFADGGSRVVVTGTIVGGNGCQTAVHSVQRTKSGLVITVATERDASANASCTLALVELDYRFSVNVENTPESVTVIHRGAGGKKTIVTVTPGG